MLMSNNAGLRSILMRSVCSTRFPFSAILALDVINNHD